MFRRYPFKSHKHRKMRLSSISGCSISQNRHSNLMALPMPPAPWFLARWVFAVWFCFSGCLCMCWLAGFCMLVVRSYFRIAVISEAGAVIFRIRNHLLAWLVLLFWHLAGPFWYLGVTLADHESSSMDTLGSGFSSLVLGRFWDPTWRAFRVPG